MSAQINAGDSLGDALEGVFFNEHGLVPVIVQDATSQAVLMMAWMNAESLRATVNERRTVFWSRSRGELWRKGETSGNVQQLVSLSRDCDGDALLALVHQHGPACHTGAQSCFSDREISTDGDA